ncbi:hypothetical protein [uncultured Zoogloea sp.]|uniref:hypothetical protein n=1 Tax=uncultured Zoogloea sp. TaxID=160237 RepID=UPI0026075940|nr:hypothetical protein [uncultured Zoogloea sp.]
MSRPCSVPQCPDTAAGFGALCNRHKAIRRRHGHPEQTGVTVQELAPFRLRVRLRMEKNQGNQAWGILAQRWGMIIDAAKAQEAEAQRGRPFVAHERDACQELVKLAREVPVETLTETVLALFLMQEEQPRRFKSDAAFDAQLARRARALTDTNAGTYWDDKAKRSKRVYRDVAPRTLAVIAEHLKAAFGVAGLYVARLEQRESEQTKNQQAALVEALESLK